MIRPLSYTPFSPAEIAPEGWLKAQLRLQADSLMGHLDTVWPDIRDSMWIGGSRNDWERVPYWLDGFIPLAYLLDDDDLKRRAAFYVNGILDRQCEDGWLCPTENRYHYDTWAALLLCKVLALWCEATGDTRAEDALYRALKQFTTHIDGTTLHNWGAARWFEGLIPIFWLYEKRREDWLLLLAKKLDVQGFDWEKVFRSGMLSKLTESWDYISHVVNIAMMLKSRSLASRLTGEDPDRFAKDALSLLREHHGMATGHFTGDENLSGNSPIQGSELCSVVEAMYSFETLFSVSGDPFWLEALEKEAFNALPAAFSPDMWTHQYVQLTNQVQCARTDRRVFRTNNEEAHIFGLEPHYGCCTANMGQGFPKLALNGFMKTADGFAAAIPLPMTVKTSYHGVPVTLSCKTEYPFRNTAVYTVKAEKPIAFTFSIRTPSEVTNAAVNRQKTEAGHFLHIHDTFTEATFTLTFTPVLRFEKRPREMYALWYGNLLFSLPISFRSEMREYEKDGVIRKFPYCDYYHYPTSAWQYGFTSSDIEGIRVSEHSYTHPFSPDTPPVTLTLALSPIPWQMPDGRCAVTPDSRKAVGAPEALTLIPYGASVLRMTEMPLVES